MKENEQERKHDLEKLFEDAPETPVPYYLAAREALLRKADVEAQKHIDILIQMRAYQFFPETLKGMILSRSGKPALARTYFEKAVKNAPADLKAYPQEQLNQYERFLKQNQI